MKTKLHSLFIGLLLLAGLVQTQTALADVTFSVTPAAVSNTYNGPITLLAAGLTAGDTVVVQVFLDANSNGVIDAGDILQIQFNLTDGTNSVIGGVTNINVPGDTDATAGQITANLNFQAAFSRAPTIGNYLVKLSSPAGHFTPITNSFAVTSFPYPQKFTGTVLCNGAAVPNARVFLFPTAGGLNGVGEVEAVADNSGHYILAAPPGTYSLAAGNINSLGDLTAAANLVLGVGAIINTNLTCIAATQTISGTMFDADNSSVGLPGLLVALQSPDGLMGMCFTDTNGNFTAGVNANQWTMTHSYNNGLALHGYVGLQSEVPLNTATGSVSNVTIALPKATALFYGAVKDTSGKPVPAVLSIDASDDNYYGTGFTDTNGHYVAAALGGLGNNDTWDVGVDSFPNYFFSGQTIDGNINAGQAVLQNFTAIPATNYISGWLKDNSGNPIAGVEIYADAWIDGFYDEQEVDTDVNGNYSLSVTNGAWQVEVDNWGGDDSLPPNYIRPADQYPVISNNNAVVNFTATLTLTFTNTSGTFTFAVDNGTITILRYAGSATAVAIPTTITNLPVTSIGDSAFAGTSLTSVAIPNGVASIGDMAFQGCSGLTSLTIPNSVTSIGTNAFANCTALTNLTFGDSVTNIGDSAFNGCTSLTSVTLPNSITSIGASAFANCTGLTNVTIGDYVTNIGDSAFNGCTSLTSVTLPNSVTNIGASAFANCTGLTNVTIGGRVTNVGDSAFNGCASLTSVTIPDSVTNIGNRAFAGTSLMSVTIPNSVTSIGDSAFSWCDRLTSVSIPNSVANIGEYAFAYCASLTSAYFNGNAPNADCTVFADSNNVEVYCLPWSTGWSGTFPCVPIGLFTPGLLGVTITPAAAISAGAQWQVDGGTPQSSGVTVSNLSIGPHTVSFTPVSGWYTPADQTVTITYGATTNVTGFYALLPANLGAIKVSGTNLVLSGINGQSGGEYCVLMSTNPALPLIQWTPIAANALSVGGNFTIIVTNTVTPGPRQRFYILQETAVMTLIPAGTFMMGDTLDYEYDAAPASANVSAFYMDTNLVSYSQWQTVYNWATNHGYGFDNPGAGKAANHPVQTVDWYDTVKWCNARSQQAGLTPVYYTDVGLTQAYTNGEVDAVYVNWGTNGYRLPTEAEWEKAARGGLSGQRFPWGNVITESLANYYGDPGFYTYDLGPSGDNEIGSIGGTSPATSPVGSFGPNGYGLYDMAGNVFEWCWDCYGMPYAGGSDPRGPASSPYDIRVMRGGGWCGYASHTRCANRDYDEPSDAQSCTGFRCVRGL